jgi:hypothetical protein
MGLDDFRKRNEQTSARIARQPFAAWVVHTIAFAGFAVVFQLLRGAPADWARALVIGAVVAVGAVAGTVIGYRRRNPPPEA